MAQLHTHRDIAVQLNMTDPTSTVLIRKVEKDGPDNTGRPKEISNL